MKTYIGVDLGGTNVRVALVDEHGTVLQDKKEASEVDKGVPYVIQKIIRLIESLDNYENAEGIGMGVPGPVDTVAGKIVVTNNLPGFAGEPLAQMIQDHFKKPTFMDNDVNVAGLGEATLGAGKGKSIVYYITVSTGIGGALMIDGKVIAGKHGHAGELCNIVVDRNREARNGLAAGALENEASGTAITRKGKELFGDSIEHAGDVFQLAADGNEQALELVDSVAYDLAQGFAATALVIDPEIFVLGGGVMKSKEIFFNRFHNYFKELVFPGMRDIEFAYAQLDEPGIVGAAMLPLAYINK